MPTPAPRSCRLPRDRGKQLRELLQTGTFQRGTQHPARNWMLRARALRRGLLENPTERIFDRPSLRTVRLECNILTP